MAISIIAAVARNGVIGRGNRLPWHLPEDLKRFRQLTWGCAIVMGRKTYESLGRALPGRENIVVTRQAGFAAAGCRVEHSIESVLGRGDTRETFVIGGADLYAAALPLASRLYLTEIQADVQGDAFFPSFDRSNWRETSRELRSEGAPHAFAYHFVTYERS